MTMTIHINIVSAESDLYSGLATMVIAPAVMGDVGVTPRHAPLLSPLRAGEVRVKKEDGTEEGFYVSGGMLEVQPHMITVLADTALRAKDLDEAAALEAKQRAEKLLADKKSDIDYSRAQAELSEAMAQLQAIQRLRGRR
ncbi:F0F1 ATP synthase subunit epsilon [Beggiatoa leptomitoformis]|uniref:ATP synthase epsilon chain n=1 Tax=Beggiatoa leptomitoformis TaxID=288004 RepID=A0A2N9YHL2_9GAMM|nr:F0F1 ATP synthase subunit epsilon [Beggiatoa leptomitoformis]ALG67853.1 F0F1 ATP synthase subunit epsilon [Beggiatoa leptomitoformis]AUI69889.1 F0F1 ATP synthase subunit epsilon [Beggiatoa leptomitoformis]